MQIDQDIDYTATIKTNHGDIVVDLYEKDTPKAVNNFIFLAKENFYDGLLFHRVVENFVIQGGDPNGNGSGGPGYTFNDEILAKYTFSDNGVLAMANSGTNTNGSQFFITVTGSNPTYLNGKHTIFGKVISGMDVVDEISKVSTDSSDKPLSDVVIEDIVIHEN
ncbi:peptidylprolyl isomerase [Candidatus Dojkabacteria bacterium]|nr:peptidylprolyl isomerase [Candidatus Dojkabacteria bacterium]